MSINTENTEPTGSTMLINTEKTELTGSTMSINTENTELTGSTMSILNPTILDLSSQGFFCIPLIKGSNGIAFASKNKGRFLPTTADYRSKCIPPEKWEKLFKLSGWENVDKIAIMGGANGVLAFDFDPKSFDDDKEKQDKAWKIWKIFKFNLEVSHIPFYLERSKSGGEHIIILCNLDVENVFSSQKNICPVFSTKFIECFALNENGKPHHMITIAPSEGYKQLSDVSLTDLQRIDAEQRACVMSFFDSYQQQDEEKKAKDIVSPAKKKKEPQEFKHYLTQEEIFDHIRRDYNLIQELESLGYERRGDRLSKPHKVDKSDTDLQLYENNTKFTCFSPSDPFYCSATNRRDVIDVLRYKYGDSYIKELHHKVLEDRAPHQITPDFLNAENYDEVLKAIHKSSKDRIVMNVYESPDKSETVLQVKTTSGDLRYFDLHEFLGQNLEQTGATFFESGEYRTASGSFSPLKIRILDEKLMAPRKLLLETSCWIDGKFYYNSSDECYIRNELIEEPKASFEEWKTNVFDVAVKSSGTALGMLMGFAAPFVDILHQSFGINLVGDSNIGKSMTLRIAKGMFRDADKLESWSGTASSIEKQKFECANGVLCLDEMYHADENALGSIMQLCGVTERKRCSWDGAKLNIAKSNEVPVLILSTSETPFVQAAKRYQMKVTKGQLNRFLDFNVTKDDFIPNAELTLLKDIIQQNKGFAITKLCEHLQDVNVSNLKGQFKKHSEKYKERLSKMAFAKQRVLTHLIFLDFVADFVSEKLGLDGRQMFENSKVLFDRFLDDSQEVLEDGDAIEINAVKEKIVEMLESSKYTCANTQYSKSSDNTCIYVADDEFFCMRGKVVRIISQELNLSKRQVLSILKTLDILYEGYTSVHIYTLNKVCSVYQMKNLENICPDIVNKQ